MNIFHHLHQREIGRASGQRPGLAFAVDKYKRSSLSLGGVQDDPLLAIAVRNDVSSSHRVLVASESGIVRLIDGQSMKMRQEWEAHQNAIFDIKWRPNHDECITCSGDTSFSLWDVDRPGSRVLRQKSAHMSSIKSLSFMDENVMATASRDGFVHVWDIRTGGRIHTITDAHAMPGHGMACGSSAKKKRYHKVTGTATSRSNPVAAVTSVLFQSGTSKLFSAGASDACIKLWDIRMLGNGSSSASGKKKGRSAHTDSQQQKCVRVFHAGGPGAGNSRHGFSGLAFDQRFNIYASCSDHKVYSFDPCSGDQIATFASSSYRTDIFTKITILDDLLISGSVPGSTPVWIISDANRIDPCYKMDVKPRFILPHDEEVTVVDVHPFTRDVYSLSDDIKINKWSLFAKIDRHDDSCGQSEVRAVRYQERGVEIEEILPRIRSMSSSGHAASPPCLSMTPTSSRAAPLTTIKDWLTIANSTTTPNTLPSSQSSSSSYKKRSHSGSKENSQETPVILTPDNRKAKKIRNAAMSSRKISDYFHA